MVLEELTAAAAEQQRSALQQMDQQLAMVGQALQLISLEAPLFMVVGVVPVPVISHT